MSEGSGAAPGGDDLQFDKVEFATGTAAASGAATACAFCNRGLVDAYFEVSGRVVCVGCKDAVCAAFTGGSRSWRVFKATFYGGLAGIAGALLWIAVTAATGYNLGLISILVGMGVGAAVGKGAGHRGGLFYQLLAVALTYGSICLTYVPVIYTSLVREDRGATKVASAEPAASPASPASPRVLPPVEASPQSAAPSATSARLATPDPAATGTPTESTSSSSVRPGSAPVATPVAPAVPLAPSPLHLLIGALMLYAAALATPFLIATSGDGLMHVLIIAFGLHEAWKANPKLQLQLNGPFSLASRPPPSPAP